MGDGGAIDRAWEVEQIGRRRRCGMQCRLGGGDSIFWAWKVELIGWEMEGPSIGRRHDWAEAEAMALLDMW